MSLATSLLEAFNVLPDPRLTRGKGHRWSELLFIAACALLTGAESFYDLEEFAQLREEWLRTFLVLPGEPARQGEPGTVLSSYLPGGVQPWENTK